MENPDLTFKKFMVLGGGGGSWDPWPIGGKALSLIVGCLCLLNNEIEYVLNKE